MLKPVKEIAQDVVDSQSSVPVAAATPGWLQTIENILTNAEKNAPGIISTITQIVTEVGTIVSNLPVSTPKTP